MYRAPRSAWWLATGFGSGYLKPAPGTWGSLAGVAAWLGLVWIVRGWALPLWVLLAAPLALTLMAVWAAGGVVAESGLSDPAFVVADEWAGVWAARLVAPFLLFRLFDIWKPGAVDRAQQLPGGWGVVADDVLAGLLAALLVWPLDRWLGAQSLLHPGLWP